MTTLSVPPGTITVYLNSSGDFVYNGVVQTAPLTIINSNPPTGILTVYFDSQGNTIVNASRYFNLNSSNIVFDGQNIPINVNVINFNGLLRKTGVDTNVTVQYVNIKFIGGSLNTACGWVLYLNAKNVNVNYCSSDGPTSFQSGGIVGGAVNTGGDSTVNITNCFSTGQIQGQQSGGIVGALASASFTNCVCNVTGCYSTGDITGLNSGGIFGYRANYQTSPGGLGNTNNKCYARNCYSLGNIINNGGGIFAPEANYNANSQTECVAENCYSIGSIINNSGGIFGINSSVNASLICTASNCYSQGTIGTGCDGIFGSNIPGVTFSPGNTYYTYSSNGSWSDNAANGLTGLYPSGNTGGNWVSAAANTPFLLGYYITSWNNIYPPITPSTHTFDISSSYDLTGLFKGTQPTPPNYPNTGLIYNYMFLNKNSFTGTINTVSTGFFNGNYFNLDNQFYKSPAIIQNINPLNINFNSYRNINTLTNNYLILNSDNISFNWQGSPLYINVANYPGFLRKNGSHSNIVIQNVSIVGVTFGTLVNGCGWIGQTGWNGGKFIRCNSSGPIPVNGGGIVGSSATNVTIVNCYQNGTIGSGGGALLGANSTQNNIEACFISNSPIIGTGSSRTGYLNSYALSPTPQNYIVYNLLTN